ncbi:MAG: hypothetical protein GX816_01555 [Erysipelotrichia bacterium]|nr:hypothetical protein [Erysipelotrichia bacterium]
MNRKMLLLPLLSFFVVGCNGQNAPFTDDQYKPKGMAPTHKIVEVLPSEEEDIFDSTVEESDAYLTAATITSESRFYGKKVFPSHSSVESFDERNSQSNTFTRYENRVSVFKNKEFASRVYEGTLIKKESKEDTYNVLNESEDEIAITTDVTSFDGENHIETNTISYDPLFDYETYFQTNITDFVLLVASGGMIGLTKDKMIAMQDMETSTTPPDAPYIAGDGVGFIVETNSMFEAYFAKRVDNETEEEYYHLASFRLYTEYLVLSEEIPNMANESIVYLTKPVLLGYEETILTTKLTSNGNFVTSTIPQPTEI